MVAFVTDRGKFLQCVIDAVQEEHADPAAAKMIVFLTKSSVFLPAMPALLNDKDPRIREDAFLALGNLIVSDNKEMRKYAFDTACKCYPHIVAAFAVHETFGCAAYVLRCMSLSVNLLRENKMCQIVLNDAKSNISNAVSPCSKCDLLDVINNIGAATDVPIEALLDLVTVKNPKIAFTALNMLGDCMSGPYPEVYFDRTYQTLRLMLSEDKKTPTAHKMIKTLLWTFANLVTEKGVCDKFLNDLECVNFILAIVYNEGEFDIAKEGVWVLGNALANVNIKSVDQTVLMDINQALDYFNEEWDEDDTVVEETQVTIKAELQRRSPNVPIHIDVDETDSDSTVSTLCEDIPTAVDLLMAQRVFEPTSKTVADLIESVRANDNNFTPVPPRVLLSIYDLKALEARGFVIHNGYVGINPYIVSVFSY